MCIVFCHRLRILYENHEDCDEDFCPVVTQACKPCHTCIHKRNDMTCSLTNRPLPNDESGCCHWGITFVEGPLQATPAMVAPLPMTGFYEQVQHILPVDIPREQTSDGKWLIASVHIEILDRLGIEYHQHHHSGAVSGGVVIDPNLFVLAINEPVSDILDGYSIPYHRDEANSLITIDPGEFVLPKVFGKADFCI